MSEVLRLLASSREARREVALIKLADARRGFDLAYAACEQALLGLKEAQQWREDLLFQCTLGAHQALRESVLPACEALLLKRQQQFKQNQGELSAAYERMNDHKQAVMQCERDVQRLQQWQAQHEADLRRFKALEEERWDEEVSSSQMPGARA